MFRVKVLVLLCGALAIGLAATMARADEKIVLRFADSFPVGHFIPRYLITPWMEAVTKETKGRVEFEYFPAQQLGKVKDFLSLTQSGVADVAYIVPAFISDKMPLSGVVELPGGFDSSCKGTLAYLELAKNGYLAKNEFAPNGVRLLFVLVNPPYQILTKQPLTSIDSVKGLKLRTAGGAMEIMARKLGIVPVRMPGPEVYESLSRGTLDGLVFPLANVMEYDLQGLVRYTTVGQNFGSFVHNFMISEKRWKELPADVQEVMDRAGVEMTREACKKIDADVAPAIETLKKAGVTVVDLPSEDVARIKPVLAEVGEEWAAELDRRERPGTATLKAFSDALNATN